VLDRPGGLHQVHTAQHKLRDAAVHLGAVLQVRGAAHLEGGGRAGGVKLAPVPDEDEEEEDVEDDDDEGRRRSRRCRRRRMQHHDAHQ